MVSSGREKVSSDLAKAFTFMGSYKLDAAYGKKVLWKKISSSNVYGLYATFMVISEAIDTKSYRELKKMILENGDRVTFKTIG